MEKIKPKLIVPAGHANNIDAITCSPDKTLIATGGVDGAVIIWNREGRLLNTIRAENFAIKNTTIDTAIKSLCFSPDSQQILVTYYSGVIILWDAIKGDVVFLNKEVDSSIYQTAFTETGEEIIIRGWNFLAMLNAKTGEIKKAKIEFDDGIDKFVLNKNKILVSNGNESIMLLDATVWEKISPIKVSIEYVYSIQLFPENDKAIIAGSEKIIILDFANQKEINLPIPELENFHDASFQFQPDEKKFIAAFGTAKQILTFDATTLQQTEAPIFPEIDIYQHIISEDAALLVCRFSDQSDYRFSVVDASSGKLLQMYDPPVHRVKLSKLAADGKQLFSLVGPLSKDKQSIKALQLDHELPLKSYDAHSSFDTTKDGTQISTFGERNQLTFWNLAKDQKIGFNNTSNFSHPVISPNEQLVAIILWRVGEASKGVEVFDIQTGALLHSLHFKKLKTGNNRSINRVYFTKDSKRLIGTFKNDVISWDLSNNQKEGKILFNFEESDVFASRNSKDNNSLWSLFPKAHIQDFIKLPIDLSHQILDNRIGLSWDRSKVITLDFYLGFKVWDAETGKAICSFGEHLKSGIDNPCLSTFERGGVSFVMTTTSDNNIHIWNLDTGASIGTIHLLNETDWVATTPSGLFDASPGAMKEMYYVIGREIIELNQLKDRYYQPRLLAIILNFIEDELRDVSAFEGVDLYPEIELCEVRGDFLYVTIKEREGGIGDVNLFINNKEIEEDIRPEGKSRFRINLTDYEDYYTKGNNVIGIRCWNEEGWLPSQIHEDIYENTSRDLDDSAPSLYAIFIGTSNYQNKAFSLAYPDQDATYLSDALQIVGEKYFKENVHIQLLTTNSTNTNVSSKQNIEQAFEDLAKKAKSKDVAVFYFSGHGANYDDGKKAQYYYLTKEVVSDNLSDQAIRENATVSTNELTKWLNRIPAKKQVLILDTCYSGKVVEGLKSKSIVDATRDRAMERMKDRTGTFVLTGSAADKVSYEASNYGQGLLTYSLLQGMKGAALKKSANQGAPTVDVITLLQFSREEVPRLAGEFTVSQMPTLRVPTHGESFDIGISDKEAQSNIKLAMPKPVFVKSNFLNTDTFYDDLNISETLDQYFSQTIGKGRSPEAILLNITKFPGAHAVKGLYSKMAEGFKVMGKVYKSAKSLGHFEVEGIALEDIIPKIEHEVDQLTFIDEGDAPIAEDEMLLLEKRAKDDLAAIKDKPYFGYQTDFIDKEFKVPMPTLNKKQQADVAPVEGNEDNIAHYQYYSVMQSKSRKLPFFAVNNFNGEAFMHLKRKGSFMIDPRIPREYQWGNELYNDFKRTQWDRGHMTKREDTQWANLEDPNRQATAFMGAKLSFFFTNSVPQNKGLNRGTWGNLEDYIVKAAGKDVKAGEAGNYKINIFTGPTLREDDPVFLVNQKKKTEKLELQVPVSFWKIVYFKKSDNNLYRVGFLMGQQDLLNDIAPIKKKGITEEEKDLFTAFKAKEVYQVPVSFIEKVTGLTFHKAIDPQEDKAQQQLSYKKIFERIQIKGKGITEDDLIYEMEGLNLG